MLKEVGALISLQPNASRIVSNWNIDSYLKKARPIVDKAFQIFNSEGALQNTIDLSKRGFSAEMVCYHRQDLRSCLVDAVKSKDLPGSPPIIRTSSVVIACNCEDGTVTLADGDVLKGDLVVGADGIHSVLRKEVLGFFADAKPTGVSAYRMLIDTKQIENIPSLKDTFSPRDHATTMIFGYDRRIIMGPGRGGDLYGVFALLKDIFRQAPSLALSQLRDIDSLPTWVKGRTIIIGDASHVMLPAQGQGASQSVEDAEALQAFFADIAVSPSADQRASLIQAYSRQQAKPATDGISDRVHLNPAEFLEYNCGYQGALEWWKKNCGGG
ncbi:FAD/NAD(P)-binding domain-containing protein [Glonium stellatum]|uniref:FAD/NAD(P)-binding domain-containing protein n=1 Tax=Glonium stellatum TaxID=574774 RepID=A0A8E2FDM8_9PEZI|nr:FAD/NAD(P)-binding domain-containing protein [Glonium stellatum]